MLTAMSLIIFAAAQAIIPLLFDALRTLLPADIRAIDRLNSVSVSWGESMGTNTSLDNFKFSFGSGIVLVILVIFLLLEYINVHTLDV